MKDIRLAKAIGETIKSSNSGARGARKDEHWEVLARQYQRHCNDIDCAVCKT